jgi:hypothetical protein
VKRDQMTVTKKNSFLKYLELSRTEHWFSLTFQMDMIEEWITFTAFGKNNFFWWSFSFFYCPLYSLSEFKKVRKKSTSIAQMILSLATLMRKGCFTYEYANNVQFTVDMIFVELKKTCWNAKKTNCKTRNAHHQPCTLF